MNRRLALVLLITACLRLHPGKADTLTGEVRGRILDIQGGAPIAGALVTLTNADRGWKKQVQTDAIGQYILIQLEPGNYSLAIEKEGYYRTERTDILVPLNQPKVVVPPIELRKLVSSPTQQITLRGEQTRTAIIDLTAPGPTPAVLAYVSEPGRTSMVSLLDWALRSNFPALLIHSLPLRGGRSFDQISLFSAGVFWTPFSSGHGPAVGIGVGSAGQFSVNGLRARTNNFTVDGSDNNDEDIGVRRQGFVSLVPQSIESVQELQILTAGFPAEFGRNSGAMVNAVSRSGQKAVHGEVYGIFSNDTLNARNFFDVDFQDFINAGEKSGGSYHGKDFSSQQYGGVLAGPLIAGRVFHFISAEQERYRGTGLGHFVVPTAQERGLRLRSGFVPIAALGDFLASRDIPYSSRAGEGVFSLYPLPNNPAGPFGEHNYSQARRIEGTGTIFSYKVDWYLSAAHSFFARYNTTSDNSILPFTSEAIDSSLATDTRTQNVATFLNSTFSGYANALRFSYGRTRLAFPARQSSPLLFGSSARDGSTVPPAQVIKTPYGSFGPFGATGPIGQLSILPYSPIGIDVYNFPQGRADNTFQVSDFLTRTTTAHSLKFGFDIRRSQLNSFADRNSRPLLMFGYGKVSMGCMSDPDCIFATEDGWLRGADLAALGAPSGFLQTISTDPYPDTTIGLRFTQYDFFVQEDWKARPNLTLNMGLRYELQTTPTEVNRRIERTFGLTPADFGHLKPSGSVRDQIIISNGNLAFDTALEALQAFIAGREKIYDADRRRFGPRFGLAWDPFGDGTTAIRAGYSLSFDANLGAVTSQSRNVFPTFVPLNLDLNFSPPSGLVINSPTFFTFVPTQTPLIRPGTLNSYNLTGDAFATGLGTLFIQAPPLPSGDLSSNGLAFTLPERRLKSPYAQHFLLSVERQFKGEHLAALRYVRTVGLHLPRFATPNAGLISTPVLLSSRDRPLIVLDLPPSTDPTGFGRPKQGLGAFTVFEHSANSSYDSLQVSLERNWVRGLQYRLNWTWSHALDQVSDPFDGRGFYSLPQDSSQLQLERASANFDARHRATGLVVWDLPAVKAGFFFRDWRLAATAESQTGQPYTVNTSLDRNGDGNLTDRLETMNGITVHAGDPIALRLGPAVSALSLVAPSQGKSGRVQRNSFRASPIATVDMSLSRRFSFSDGRALAVRAEVFNLFNRTHLGIPIRTLESPGFGRNFDTQVDPRAVKFSLRLIF